MDRLQAAVEKSILVRKNFSNMAAGHLSLIKGNPVAAVTSTASKAILKIPTATLGFSDTPKQQIKFPNMADNN
jgi:hypothetical protein